ncbi:MAG TPA: phosphocarrier protein HPr [Acholeplasmataceae bacterium]|nr:phosphocarrier protein HPr [Acholeplasmataceae bacterium]
MNQTFYIISEYGLHARPATKLVNIAMSFQSEIHLTWDNKTINLKSIMGLMSLGIYHGQTITIETEGVDAFEALEALSSFMIEGSLAKKVS